MADRELTPLSARSAAGLVFCAHLVLALLLAFTSGALDSDLAGFEDEPSHFVSALLVRDWLAGGANTNPVTFAEQYYLHYPKVAIGQWPPVFHGILGGWMLLFGVSTASVLMLQALLTAAIGTLAFGVTRRAYGVPAAALAGALFVLLAPVQEFGHMAMTELSLTLFCTLAVLAFGRFLDTSRARWAMAFAGCATLAILTKGNALALALVPLAAIVALRRWDLLRRPALWGAATLVALACAPWYALTLSIATGSWVGGITPNLDFSLGALAHYGGSLAALGGYALLVAAAAGLWRGCAARRGVGGSTGRSTGRGIWVVLAVWPACLLALHVVLPSSLDDRHLILLAPSFVCGVAAAAHALGERLDARKLHPSLAPALLLVVFGLEAFERPLKEVKGFGDAARLLVQDPSLRASPLLIASDSFGEGAFVAGVAAAEQRPGHIVLRATKVLGTSDWAGRDYRPTYSSTFEMQAFLAAVPVGVVVFDASTQRHHWNEHQDTLFELLESDPDRWVWIGSLDVVRAGTLHTGALRLYRQNGHAARLPAHIDLQRVLGRELPSF